MTPHPEPVQDELPALRNVVRRMAEVVDAPDGFDARAWIVVAGCALTILDRDDGWEAAVEFAAAGDWSL